MVFQLDVYHQIKCGIMNAVDGETKIFYVAITLLSYFLIQCMVISRVTWCPYTTELFPHTVYGHQSADLVTLK